MLCVNTTQTRSIVYGSTRLTLDSAGRIIDHQEIIDFEPSPSPSKAVESRAKSTERRTAMKKKREEVAAELAAAKKKSSSTTEMNRSTKEEKNSSLLDGLQSFFEKLVSEFDDDFDNGGANGGDEDYEGENLEEEDERDLLAADLVKFIGAMRLPEANPLIWSYTVYRIVTKEMLKADSETSDGVRAMSEEEFDSAFLTSIIISFSIIAAMVLGVGATLWALSSGFDMNSMMDNDVGMNDRDMMMGDSTNLIQFFSNIFDSDNTNGNQPSLPFGFK